MNKYFLALAFIFMFAIQGFKSMQEEMELETEMETEEEQPGRSAVWPAPGKRPQICKRKDYDRCAKTCRKQRKPMCWCAWRMYSAPKYQCQCKYGRFCPPFPKF